MYKDKRKITIIFLFVFVSDMDGGLTGSRYTALCRTEQPLGAKNRQL